MANIPAPKKETKKAVKKIEKPKGATEQSPPDAVKPLQLKLPEHKKNEYKAFAAIRGIAMNDLFLEMFEEYKEKHA